MGGSLGFLVEAMVAVLLAVTIGYCVLVNRKLDNIRSDKSELRAIIRDLYAATTHAEKAIGALRGTAGELEEVLGTRIALARKTEGTLTKHIERGDALISRLAAVSRSGLEAPSSAGRGSPGARPPAGLVDEDAATSRPRGLRHSEMGLGLLNAQQRGGGGRASERQKDVA